MELNPLAKVQRESAAQPYRMQMTMDELTWVLTGSGRGRLDRQVQLWLHLIWPRDRCEKEASDKTVFVLP